MNVMRVLFCLALAFSAQKASASAEWPNEPAGSALLTDWAFNSMSGSGWGSAGGAVSIASDAAAPLSPSNVLQQTFSQGMGAGVSPGNVYCTFAPTPEIYLGFWWKVNAGWQQNSANMGKIIFLSTNAPSGGNNLFFYMGGPAGSSSYSIGMQNQNSYIDNSHLTAFPGVIGTIDIPGSQSFTPGSWVRIELYVKRGTTTTSKNGVLRFWVNGVLSRDIRNMNFEPYDFVSVPIVPIWGGTSGTKTQTDYYWYDHVRISRPNNAVLPDLPLVIVSSPTPAQVGRPYSATLQAANGKAPYAWTVTLGSLPAGLSLNKTTGLISGTPTTGGKTNFTIKVMDSSVPALESTKATYIIVSGTSGILTGSKIAGEISMQMNVDRVNGATRFQMDLLHEGEWNLTVHDLMGRKVLGQNGNTKVGSAVWTTRDDIQNGTYIARLSQGTNNMARRFCIVR